MSFEVVKESIKLNNITRNLSAQTILSNDIIVPDTKSDVVKIVFVDSQAVCNEVTVQDNFIDLRGTIFYKILYIADDVERSIKSINTRNDFSFTENIKDLKLGMRCNVKCTIEHNEPEILNGRKVSIRSVVNFSGKIIQDLHNEFVSDIQSNENIQVLKDSLKVNSYLGESTSNFKVNESLEVPSSNPPILDILANNIKIMNIETAILDNRVIVKADLNISTIYLDETPERNIHSIKHEIPFSESIELADIDENSICNIDFEITDFKFEEAEDGFGELRNIVAEVSFRCSVQAFRNIEMQVVKDAYSLNSKLDIDKIKVRTCTFVNKEKREITLKENTFIDNNYSIAEVLELSSTPLLYEIRSSQNQIVIEGVVKNRLIYTSDSPENYLNSFDFDLPFSKTIDINHAKEGSEIEINLDIKHCNYNLVSSNEIEIRQVIDADISYIEICDFELINDIDLLNEEISRTSLSSVMIYFCQPKDTVWDIAKRYSVTVSKIRDINNLGEHDEVLVGQQVIIPGKVG